MDNDAFGMKRVHCQSIPGRRRIAEVLSSIGLNRVRYDNILNYLGELFFLYHPLLILNEIWNRLPTLFLVFLVFEKSQSLALKSGRHILWTSEPVLEYLKRIRTSSIHARVRSSFHRLSFANCSRCVYDISFLPLLIYNSNALRRNNGTKADKVWTSYQETCFPQIFEIQWT